MIIAQGDGYEICCDCLLFVWFAAFEAHTFELEWVRLYHIAHQRLIELQPIDASED